MHPSGPLRLPSPRTPYERRLSLVRPSLVAVMPPGVAAKAPAFRLENATGHDRVVRCHVRSDLALSVPILACPIRHLLVRSDFCLSDPFRCLSAPNLTWSIRLLWVRPAPYPHDPPPTGCTAPTHCGSVWPLPHRGAAGASSRSGLLSTRRRHPTNRRPTDPPLPPTFD
jgi:hypothetical protein